MERTDSNLIDYQEDLFLVESEDLPEGVKRVELDGHMILVDEEGRKICAISGRSHWKYLVKARVRVLGGWLKIYVDKETTRKMGLRSRWVLAAIKTFVLGRAEEKLKGLLS